MESFDFAFCHSRKYVMFRGFRYKILKSALLNSHLSCVFCRCDEALNTYGAFLFDVKTDALRDWYCSSNMVYVVDRYIENICTYA